MPSKAVFMRFDISNLNGVVTTPTTRTFISLAASAITGAAPVPVPPPMPAVTKSISAPAINSLIFSRLSLAALVPTWGFAPAPSPLVKFSPNMILLGA